MSRPKPVTTPSHVRRTSRRKKFRSAGCCGAKRAGGLGVRATASMVMTPPVPAGYGLMGLRWRADGASFLTVAPQPYVVAALRQTEASLATGLRFWCREPLFEEF